MRWPRGCGGGCRLEKFAQTTTVQAPAKEQPADHYFSGHNSAQILHRHHLPRAAPRLGLCVALRS